MQNKGFFTSCPVGCISPFLCHMLPHKVDVHVPHLLLSRYNCRSDRFDPHLQTSFICICGVLAGTAGDLFRSTTLRRTTKISADTLCFYTLLFSRVRCFVCYTPDGTKSGFLTVSVGLLQTTTAPVSCVCSLALCFCDQRRYDGGRTANGGADGGAWHGQFSKAYAGHRRPALQSALTVSV